MEKLHSDWLHNKMAEDNIKDKLYKYDNFDFLRSSPTSNSYNNTYSDRRVKKQVR